MKRAILFIVALVAGASTVIWWLRGVQQADSDYERFARNIMRWLSRAG